MKMNKKSMRSILVVLVAITGVVVVFGNGCGQQFESLDQSSIQGSMSNSGLTGSAPNNPSDIPVIPDVKTVSLVYANQVLNHLSACAGVAKPSDQTIQVYEQKRGAISVYGTANTITSPMMMAVTTVAGEVCNDLINQEIATGGRIFKDMTLTSNARPTTALLGDAVSRLALSCWERLESSSERQRLVAMIEGNIGVNENASARKSALMVCTAMLSSLDALLN